MFGCLYGRLWRLSEIQVSGETYCSVVHPQLEVIGMFTIADADGLFFDSLSGGFAVASRWLGPFRIFTFHFLVLDYPRLESLQNAGKQRTETSHALIRNRIIQTRINSKWR